jgi:hypothetical protein
MSSNYAKEKIETGSENEQIELRRVECFVTDSLLKRILRLIFPDQRKQERMPSPPLVGYLGTQSASKPYDIGDISLTGFCLLTNERWMPGTEMPITLQARNLPTANEAECFTVQATVVRCNDREVGFSIVLCEEDSQAAYGNPIRVQWVGRAEMEQYLKRLKAHISEPGSQVPQIEANASTKSAAGARAQGGLKTAFEGGR